MAKAEAAKTAILNTTLTFKKSTKGTHVYENDELGLQLYFPKLVFAGHAKDGNPPASVTLTLE